MQTNVDVLIIGAGPAGAEAAYHLAQGGYQTLVIEQEHLDREKVCGGGIFVQEVLEFGPLPESVVERSIRTLRIHSPHHSRAIALPENLPSGVIVKRSRYDRHLQERAQQVGAEFLESAQVVDVSYEEDIVILKVLHDGQEKVYKARLLIDASGWSSFIARRNRLKLKPEHFIASCKCWLELPEGEIDRHYQDSIDFFFNSQVVQDGYIWIFPKKKILDVGIGCLATHLIHKKIDLKARLHTFIQHHELLSQGNVVMTQGGYIPSQLYSQLTFDRTLLVGDAGGISSPLHGGGIYYARYSGRSAATWGMAYLKSEDRSCLAGYEAEIRRDLDALDFQWDEKLRPFLGDDEWVDLLVKTNHPKSERFFVEVFTGTRPHREIYEGMTDTLQEIVAREKPLISNDEVRDHVPVPTGIDLSAFDHIRPERVLLAISYCLKSKSCPVGKFNNQCGKCHQCSVAGIIGTATRNKFAAYIVTTREDFMDYLDQHQGEFDRLIAIACPAIANRIALLVNKKYGLQGYVALLRGDVCQTDETFHHSEEGIKQSQPHLNLDALQKLIDRISFRVEY